MAGLIFGVDFQKTIKGLAAKNTWKINDMNEDRAELLFDTDAGEQMVEIFQHEDGETLEFTASLQGGYDNEEDMPHEVSTMLLRRNWDLELGQWCIDEDGGQLYFTCGYNVSIRDLDALFFAEIVAALVHEAAEVEGMTAAGGPDADED